MDYSFATRPLCHTLSNTLLMSRQIILVSFLSSVINTHLRWRFNDTIRKKSREVQEAETTTTRRRTAEHTLPIIGHANINHCLFDSDGAKVIDRESNICIRWVKVAICITEQHIIL